MITPLMLTDNDYSPLYVNTAFRDIFGFTVSGIPDKDSWLIRAYPNPDYRREISDSWDRIRVTEYDDDNATGHYISRIVCKDGVSRWFDVHQHAIGSNKAFTFLNVNELKASNEDLIETLQQKETQLCSIAHDVRSPLNSIRQITGNFDHLDLSILEFKMLFQKMNGQVDHIFNIVNSLLVHTAGDRGRFIEQQEPIDLAAFFSRYANYYKERLLSHNIKFVLDLPPSPVLNYDPGILDVICRNLLDNAIKYSLQNGFINISFKKVGRYARLIIKDNGPGMTQDKIEQILYNKGNRNFNNQPTDSFGLGLVMVKEILEKYHGKLSVKSEPGKGTSFIIDVTEISLN